MINLSVYNKNGLIIMRKRRKEKRELKKIEKE